MKYILTASIIFLSVAMTLTSCESGSSAKQTEMKSITDSISYAVGMDIWKFYEKQGVSLNPELIYEGLQDLKDGGEVRLTPQQALAVVEKFQQEQLAHTIATNKIKGEKFLAENASQEGVIINPSGLQYKIIESGKNGKKATYKGKVKVSYTGRLIDGKVFSEIPDDGEGVEVSISELLPGWAEALLLMQEGDKWEIYLPSDLGYGAEGMLDPASQQVPIAPYSTLIFQIKLHKVL
ncbi:MAG: FKBP-type peptidyl-prolyl cis-trans isomerase N-terminal domain-containing protein [Bacteroidota bacterium]